MKNFIEEETLVALGFKRVDPPLEDVIAYREALTAWEEEVLSGRDAGPRPQFIFGHWEPPPAYLEIGPLNVVWNSLGEMGGQVPTHLYVELNSCQMSQAA